MPAVRAPVHGPLHDDAPIGNEFRPKGLVRPGLVGLPGSDEIDGGPPNEARYITEQSDPYRLPSMELQALLHEPESLRRYLEGALT